MGQKVFYSRCVHSIDAEASISQAACLMAKEHIGSVVVKDGERLYGLVTDRDLVLHGLLCEGAMSEQKVRDCASTPLITLPVDSNLGTMARTLKLNGVRRAVLIDEKGAAVGMLSADDLLGYLGNEVGQLATAVQREFQAEASSSGATTSVFGPE